MKVSTFTLAGIAAMLTMTGCSKIVNLGSGFKSDPSSPIVSRQMNSGAINEIQASCGLKVIYVTGSTPGVNIEAPQDLQDKIEVKNTDGDLYITLSEKVARGVDRVTVTVTAPAVSEFGASSAASLALPEGYGLQNGKLSINVSSGASVTGRSIIAKAIDSDASSGGSITLSVETEAIEVSASSGASITISGKASTGELTASSGAGINAGHLTIATGSAVASSGAQITSNIIRPEDISSSSGASISNSKE